MLNSKKTTLLISIIKVARISCDKYDFLIRNPNPFEWKTPIWQFVCIHSRGRDDTRKIDGTKRGGSVKLDWHSLTEAGSANTIILSGDRVSGEKATIYNQP